MPASSSVKNILATAAIVLFSHQAAAQPNYIAPTSRTVYSSTVEQEGSFGGHAIYVENHSTVPITVFSVHLTSCENVKQQCTVHRTNIHVSPGGREFAIRVSADNQGRAMSYNFSFSWHPDSAMTSALAVLAEGGDATARERIAARQRRDSLDRAEVGVHYNELSRDDFAALGGRAATLHAAPESLVIAPGERLTLDRVRVLVADSQGVVLGATRWFGWAIQPNTAFQFLPPNVLVARAAGRGMIRLRLADEAVTQLGHAMDAVMLPVVVAYPLDPHAPSFSGVAVDGDSKSPLGCTEVALEDSAQNVVAAGRTDRAGAFTLRTPHAGTYRVRVAVPGWAPVYGENEVAQNDEARQRQYEIRFVDQLLRPRRAGDPDAFQDAYPVAVSFAPTTTGGSRGKAPPAAAPVQRMTLNGTPAAPILGIVSRAPAGSMMSQFVVDSSGRIDPTTLQIPAGTNKIDAATLQSALSRVRFAPARVGGIATCELLRMQVDFTHQ